LAFNIPPAVTVFGRSTMSQSMPYRNPCVFYSVSDNILAIIEEATDDAPVEVIFRTPRVGHGSVEGGVTDRERPKDRCSPATTYV